MQIVIDPTSAGIGVLAGILIMAVMVALLNDIAYKNTSIRILNAVMAIDDECEKGCSSCILMKEEKCMLKEYNTWEIIGFLCEDSEEEYEQQAEKENEGSV